ncbi:hypothetical protein QY96_03212 [Bacillus thermotolerans]|nr:hypothetical protein QY96_03212 [Bacillus thermotolerans]
MSRVARTSRFAVIFFIIFPSFLLIFFSRLLQKRNRVFFLSFLKVSSIPCFSYAKITKRLFIYS